MRGSALCPFSTDKTRCFITFLLTCTCTKLLLAEGNVFLKSSSASSSLSTLMVSASATISLASISLYAAHSAFLSSQFLSRSAKNFFIFGHTFLSVFEVVLHLSNFDTQLSDAHRLGFDCFGEGLNLFLLGGDKTFKASLCRVFLRSCIGKVFVHLIFQSF